MTFGFEDNDQGQIVLAEVLSKEESDISLEQAVLQKSGSFWKCKFADFYNDNTICNCFCS